MVQLKHSAAANLAEVLQGKTPKFCINAEVLKK